MKPEMPWWNTLYLDPVMTRIMFGWKTNTRAEVDQILRQMNLPLGAHVLDLACGKGRHSIELSKRAFRVTGLDYSPLLLAKAELPHRSFRDRSDPPLLRQICGT
jgi:cyclopropane fatty-acyl-phospholipid synthase-like methyltransferase